MTGDRLKAIRDREKLATKGPWSSDPAEYAIFILAPENGLICEMRGRGGDLPIRSNQEFIANARQDIPDLLAALDEARELLKVAKDNLSCDCSQYFKCHYCDLCKRIDELLGVK